MARKGKPRFIPMPGKIVVKLLVEEALSGLSVVSDLQGTAAKARSIGEIIAIGGDEDEGAEYDLKVGDVVMFGVHSGVKCGLDEINSYGRRVRHEVMVFRTNEILTKVVWEEEEEPEVTDGA